MLRAHTLPSHHISHDVLLFVKPRINFFGSSLPREGSRARQTYVTRTDMLFFCQSLSVGLIHTVPANALKRAEGKGFAFLEWILLYSGLCDFVNKGPDRPKRLALPGVQTNSASWYLQTRTYAFSCLLQTRTDTGSAWSRGCQPWGGTPAAPSDSARQLTLQILACANPHNQVSRFLINLFICTCGHTHTFCWLCSVTL